MFYKTFILTGLSLSLALNVSCNRIAEEIGGKRLANGDADQLGESTETGSSNVDGDEASEGTQESRIRHKTETVAFAETCVSEEQTCTYTNGMFGPWSGSFEYATCEVGDAQNQSNLEFNVQAGETLIGQVGSEINANSHSVILEPTRGELTLNAATGSFQFLASETGGRYEFHISSTDDTNTYITVVTVTVNDNAKEICTVQDLEAVKSDLKIHYRQVCDIDLANVEFTSIGTGTGEKGFGGIYDGAGFTISNLTEPLFFSSKGIIRNVRIKNAILNSGRSNIGALLGINMGPAMGNLAGINPIGLVKNCHATGVQITAVGFYTGGLIGNNFGPVENVSADVIIRYDEGLGVWGGLIGKTHGAKLSMLKVSGRFEFTGDAIAQYRVNRGLSTIGGVIGSANTTEIDTVDANIDVPIFGASSWIGGIIGSVENAGNNKKLILKHATYRGKVVGLVGVGGIIGQLFIDDNVEIEDIKVDTTIIGRDYVGGVLGLSNPVIREVNSHLYDVAVNARIFARNSMGGLGGKVRLKTIENCYANVYAVSFANTRPSDLGGLIGNSGFAIDGIGEIVDCYARGTIIGRRNVGGLIGFVNLSTKIKSTYSTTRVRFRPADLDLGGLIGAIDERYSLHSIGSFWDKEASSKTQSAGGLGKSTAEMKSTGTFVDWSNHWQLPTTNNPDYPQLKSLPADSTVVNDAWPDFSQVSFDRCKLDQHDFNNTKFQHAWFYAASAVGTNFSNADLSGAVFDEADLSGANLNGANLSGASLVNTNLSGAIADNNTQLPISRQDAESRGIVFSDSN